jgi:hypothetical protein
MSAPSKTAQILVALLLLTGCFTLQLTGSAHAANAVQRAADRASHDRWARSEPSGAHRSSSSDDEEEDSESHSRSSDKVVPPGHAGELNGHLSLHGW